MDTRMSKYDSEEKQIPSRVTKNASLYEEINNKEINDFTLRSNATILGRQEPEIDIEKIKKILDTKYNELPKRKSIRLEQKDEEETENESPTKEYDLNAIIDKAKEEKEESYEEVRAKKLRDTQFDILKNLHIDEPKKEMANETAEDNDLLNLINTITINEEKEKHKKNDFEPELKEEKKVEQETKDDLLKEQEEILEETNKNATVANSIDDIKNEIEKIESTSPVLTNNTSKLDNSFYTQSNLFKKKDFNNGEDDDDKLSIFVKILIVITVIGIGVGMYFFIKSIIGF